MEKFRLVVKAGSAAEAQRHAVKRGLEVTEFIVTNQYDAVIVAEGRREVVTNWFAEDIRIEGPYPLGSLLWWTTEEERARLLEKAFA